MSAFAQMWDVVKSQLFAVVPSEYNILYKETTFRSNMSRFIAQSFVLIIMDASWLLVYLTSYRSAGLFNPVHLYVVLAKLAAMSACFFFFARRNDNGYNHKRPLDRNCDLLYPALHVALETLLFTTGPKDLGALLRFTAVPFIVGGIPIMRQERSLAILLFEYIFGWIYIQNHTVFSIYINMLGFIINYWLVVFICSLLLSFTVYSWSVNAFLVGLKEKHASLKMSELNDHLNRLSQRDSLTGLLNRRGFHQLMDAEWSAYSLNEDCTVTAMMFDIDYFKRYNDSFGHLLGDDCLARVTEVIRENLSDKCLVSRYGGEEFIAIGFCLDHDVAVQLGMRIKEAIKALKIENPGSEISPYITISIGVTTQYLRELGSYDRLIDYADKAMYFAKNNGRNTLIQTLFTMDEFLDADGYPILPARCNLAESKEFDEEYMQRVLKDISADCTFIYDGFRRRLEFSETAVELYNTPRNVLNPTIENVGSYINVAPEDRQYFDTELKNAIWNKELFIKLDIHLMMPNHTAILVAIRTQCSYNEVGKPELMYGSVFSIQKIMEYNHYLREQSMTNSVTLLPNRRQLKNDLSALLKQGTGSGYLIVIDINNFREINSTYSHNIGDKVLYETARHLSKMSDSLHTQVYSYNVDQFIVLMHNSTEENARQMMHEISQYFQSDFQLIDGLDLHVDFTMLAVDYDCYSTILDELFVDLDIAIQYAKYNKPNSFFFMTDDVRKSFLARVGLSNALKRAVEHDFEGFMLFYQPIFSGDGSTCLGAEALLRWKDAEGNIMAPNIIIPELEKASLMTVVEQWVFNTACRQCSDWIHQGAGSDFIMHINLSLASIGRPALLEDVCNAISSNGLDRKNVVFEAIETSAIFEMKTAVNSLTALKNKGLRIAIDDFGTGYSSLSYLSSLPADEIKIDKYFLKNIDKSPSDREFLFSIIGLAKSMGFLVCIEGVETTGQFKALKDMRVDYLQGYLFGKPTPANAFYANYISNKYTGEYQRAITSL